MTDVINLFEKPKLKRPVFIAAWPGMGNVALLAVNYLKDQLGAKILGEFPQGQFFAPTGALVIKQVVLAPSVPQNSFFYFQSSSLKHDILFFVGSLQPIPHKEYDYAKKLLKVAELFDVEQVITTAAVPTDMYFKDTPRVFAAPNHPDLLTSLMEHKVHFMGDGNIAGMNGLLISVAREMNIRGLCLLGEIPFFTAQMEFPHASLRILEVMSQILDIKIDMVDMELYVNQKEKEIAPVASLLMKEETAEEHPEDKEKPAAPAEDPVPRAARLLIEKLFRDAEFDRTYKSKMKLKEELDRWGVFDDYLDRFLDLFKKGKEES